MKSNKPKTIADLKINWTFEPQQKSLTSTTDSIYRNFISQDGYCGHAVEIISNGFFSYDYKIHVFTTNGWIGATGNSTSLSEAMALCDTHLISEEYSIIGPVMK